MVRRSIRGLLLVWLLAGLPLLSFSCRTHRARSVADNPGYCDFESELTRAQADIEFYAEAAATAQEEASRLRAKLAEIERVQQLELDELGLWTSTSARITNLGLLGEKYIELDPSVPTSAASTGMVRLSVQLQKLAQELGDQLSDAIVAWRPPARMTQGSETIVTAAVAYAADREKVLAALEGAGPVKLRAERITESLYVVLTSDSGSSFIIEKFDSSQPEEQIIQPGVATQWQWRVTPLRPGKHTLRLQPYLIFRRAGNTEKKRRVPVTPQEIVVDVSAGYYVGQLWRDQKAGLISVFMFPLISYVALTSYRGLRKKLQQREQENRPRIIQP